MSQPTLTELEKQLWDTADELRVHSKLQSLEYFVSVLGLIFLRYADRRFSAAEAELAGKSSGRRTVGKTDYQAKGVLYLPTEARFSSLLTLPEGANIGQAINDAMKATEEENPDFKDVLPKSYTGIENATLIELLRLMASMDIEGDAFGQIYEYFLGKFSMSERQRGGEFFTPKQVAKLMVEILQPEEGQTVYDPTCGSGGMLLEAAHYVERNGLNPKSLNLYGQEKNPNIWTICKMGLFLNDMNDAFIEHGDTLLDPQHLSGERVVQRFDIVLANPPFSLSHWGHHVWSEGDPYGRDNYGCPPKSYGDLAFVQHMVASLKSSGRMAVVCPFGVLFRRGTAEGEIRKGLLEDDLIEAVVGLGPNLFYGARIPVAVLFINRDKPAARKGKVLIVNGDKEMLQGIRNSLSDQNVARLARSVDRYEDEELFCRVVGLDEIRDNDHNLTIPYYVQTDPPRVAPIDLKVVEHEDGFALTLHEELLLTSSGGSPLWHPTRPLLDRIAHEFDGQGSIVIEDDRIVDPKFLGCYAMFSIHKEWVESGKDDLSLNFERPLFFDPVLVGGVAGPERVDQLARWEPVDEWLHERFGDQLTSLKHAVDRYHHHEEGPHPPDPPPDDEVVSALRDEYLALSPEERAAVMMMYAVHEGPILFPMALVLGKCDTAEYARGVMASMAILTGIFGDVDDHSHRQVYEGLRDDAQAALEYIGLYRGPVLKGTLEYRVRSLIDHGESAQVEFKSTLRRNLHTGDIDRKMTHSCIKTIAAFLNTKGGHLLIGVADDGEIIGIERDEFGSDDKFQLHLWNAMKQACGVAVVTTHMTAEMFSGRSGTVCLVTCKESPNPVYCESKGTPEQFFVRTGPGTRELPPSEVVSYVNEHFQSLG